MGRTEVNCIFQTGFLLALIMFSACSGEKKAQTSSVTADARYTVSAPTWNSGDKLTKITESVRKLYSVSSYTTWEFTREMKISGYHVENGQYRKMALGVISTKETAYGTATVIANNNQRLTLLTCAHIVKAPDTLISWYEPVGQDPSRYIQSISIKEKQENFIRDLSLCGSFNVILADIESDIAILGKNCEVTSTILPIAASAGTAPDLTWGSFTYILGYPHGNQTITQGLASPLPNRPMGDFTVDALLNKGYSGGILLAARNDTHEFEVVGMVSTVGSSRQDFLKPSGERHPSMDFIPYTGELFIGKSDIIQYGINTIIPIDLIKEFYRKNRARLLLAGYNPDEFFNFPLN